MIKGKIELSNSKNGFLVCDIKPDPIVQGSDLGNANHGDIVICEISGREIGGRKLARVVEIIERNNRTSGIVTSKTTNYFFVKPMTKKWRWDVRIEKKENINIGDLVELKILKWPKDESKTPFGEVVNFIGKQGDILAELACMKINLILPNTFSQYLLEEVNDISIDYDLKDRIDLRNENVFTIDPYSAKDFDDALHIKKINDNLFEVGIHIADVSHFVKKDSLIDKEAFLRGNSYYLSDGVIPMLPFKLSENLCSLVPNEDRLTFSCIVNIDLEGKVKDLKICKSIINSKKRFTYEEVQEIIDGKDNIHKKDIMVLLHISRELSKKRKEMGAVILSGSEVRAKLINNEIIIEEKKHIESHSLIEEFMLLANRLVAEFLEKNGTGIFRIHHIPEKEKVDSLLKMADFLGLEYDLENPFSSVYQSIQNQNKLYLTPLLTKLMPKAKYVSDNIGHYGLSFQSYSHFTSPIRRYSDLIIHRLLEEVLNNKKQTSKEELNNICTHINRCELIASDAERQVNRHLCSRWVSLNLMNIEVEAIVNSITDWGVYFIIDNPKIEVLCSNRHLKGTCSDNKLEWISEKRTIRLGEKYLIKPIFYDSEKGIIDCIVN